MHVDAVVWETLQDAESMHAEFPFCARCKSGAKVQAIAGLFVILCMRNPGHRGIRKNLED